MVEEVKIKNNIETESLSIAGGNYRIIISGEETKGEYAIIEMLVPPGGGPVPHSHPKTKETFFMIEGELEFKTEKGNYTIKKSDYVEIPKGEFIHNFKNISASSAKLLCTVTPAGLDDYFKDIMMISKKENIFSKTEFSKLDKKYGITNYSIDFLDK